MVKFIYKISVEKRGLVGELLDKQTISFESDKQLSDIKIKNKVSTMLSPAYKIVGCSISFLYS